MTVSKYNPTRYGREIGMKFPEKDKTTGLNLYGGCGCRKHSNCFTCPFPDCTWNDAKNKWDGE